MNGMTNDSQGLILREICSQYNLGDSTLRGWIDAGVCGEPSEVPTRRIHGKHVLVLLPKHAKKLERFLLYRSLLILQSNSARFDFNQALKLHLAVENGKQQLGIDAIDELKEILEDILTTAKLHRQSLHADLYGDAEIDPLDEDLDD